MAVARRRGKGGATIAIGRRIAVIRHSVPPDNTEFRWVRKEAMAVA
jgi:hypothetical protein